MLRVVNDIAIKQQSQSLTSRPLRAFGHADGSGFERAISRRSDLPSWLHSDASSTGHVSQVHVASKVVDEAVVSPGVSADAVFVFARLGGGSVGKPVIGGCGVCKLYMKKSW